MKSPTLFVLCLCLYIPGMLEGEPQEAAQPVKYTTYLSYNPTTEQDDLQQSIAYQFPDPARFGPGPYPLFMWTTGTFEPYLDGLAYNFGTQMAVRGFVGASVEYHNTNVFQRCQDYTPRARSIYDATRATSAVRVLCALSGVNCNQGIVTAGVSQGGAISVLAKNYAPLVAAAFAMSISDFNMNGNVNLASCLDDQFTAIPPNRLTIVNGESDALFRGQIPLMNVSGLICPSGTFQCWSPDNSGAGWYIVKDSQVMDRNADHCYYLIDFSNCSFPITWDRGWYFEAAHNWSLKPNLDWLATFGTHRVFSPNGQ